MSMTIKATVKLKSGLIMHGLRIIISGPNAKTGKLYGGDPVHKVNGEWAEGTAE